MEATGHSLPLILLVDDDENDTFLLKKAFERAGLNHPVQVLSDGMACIRYLAGEGPYTDRETFPMPAVLLLDLKLPLRNGLDVLRWIGGQPQLRKMCVVILTGSVHEAEESLALQLGANSVLTKPLGFRNAVELCGSIERLLLSAHPVGSQFVGL